MSRLNGFRFAGLVCGLALLTMSVTDARGQKGYDPNGDYHIQKGAKCLSTPCTSFRPEPPLPHTGNSNDDPYPPTVVCVSQNNGSINMCTTTINGVPVSQAEQCVTPLNPAVAHSCPTFAWVLDFEEVRDGNGSLLYYAWAYCATSLSCDSDIITCTP